MSEDRFESLNDKVETLIALCNEMKQENQLLKATQDNWQGEKQQLIERNKATKHKLESILARLKAMEEI